MRPFIEDEELERRERAQYRKDEHRHRGGGGPVPHGHGAAHDFGIEQHERGLRKKCSTQVSRTS
jgi:hypothetical protein